MVLVVPGLIKNHNPNMKDIIISFLKAQLGTAPAIIGLSGGIDSSVVAYLTAEAIGASNVYGIRMPSRTNTNLDLQHAEQVATALGIHYETITIDPILVAFHTASQDFQNATAGANLKARVRMTLLYGKANALGGRVVGTGNKSELATGYFTKYGDGGVDLLPIGGLYKFQVRALATELGIPTEIINKPPSAGLRSNQTDEADLGMTYDTLDSILQAIETGESLAEFPPEAVARVRDLTNIGAHKLVLPPIGPIV